MDVFKAKIETCQKELDKELCDEKKPWTKYLAMLEAKTNVPRSYIFLGIVGVGILYLMFGYAAQFLCNVLGIAYPAYVSIKAIESKDKLDDTKWLTYWVTFSVFSCVEFFSGVITSFIPLYWLLKCVFLMFCMAPIEQNGSVIIYNRVIRPFFLKHEQRADEIIDKIKDGVKKNIPSNILKSD